ncbi:MAG: hypothetical protein AAGF12_26605 [Myxococcota bacterium]
MRNKASVLICVVGAIASCKGDVDGRTEAPNPDGGTDAVADRSLQDGPIVAPVDGVEVQVDGISVANGSRTDLGTGNVGVTGPCAAVRVVNLRDTTLELSGAPALTGDGMALEGSTAASVTPGGDTRFEVCALAEAEGSFQATLTLPDGIPDGPFTLEFAVEIRSAPRMVAFGDNGFVALSTDLGARWTAGVTLPPEAQNASFTDAVVSGGRIVVASDRGVLRSDDGASFVLASSEVIERLAGDEQLLGLTADGTILGSSDGESWSMVERIGELSDLAFGGGVFVGAGNRRFAAGDGASFQTTNTNRNYVRIVHGNGRFVAVARDGYTASSENGTDWDESRPCQNATLQGPVFGGGRFVIRCGDRQLGSADGVRWQRVTDATGVAPEGFGGGYFVSFDGGVFRSEDGSRWVSAEGPEGSVNAIVYTGADADSGRVPTLPSCPFLRCDTFEEQASGWPPLFGWEQVEITEGRDGGPDTNAFVVDDFAFEGTRSWRIDSPAGTRQGAMLRITGEPVRPLELTQVHGRMMVYMDKLLNRWSFVTATGFAPNPSLGTPDSCPPWEAYTESCPPWEQYARGCAPMTCRVQDDPNCACENLANYNIGGVRDGNAFGNYFVNGFRADCWKHTPVIYPEREWFCFRFSIDRENDQGRFWINETEIEELRLGVEVQADGSTRDVRPEGDGCLGGRDASWVVPYFANIDVGFNPLKDQPANSVWIDDVVIDDEPVVCPSM